VKKKKKKPHKKLVRPVFLILFISTFVIASISFGLLKFYQYISNSYRFKIKRVIIRGGEDELKNTIKQLLKKDNNIFFLDKSAIKRKIEMNPWVKSVEIRKKFPDTIVLDIKKEIPFALVLIGDDLFYINPQGRPFRIKKPEEPVALPIITGINPNRADFRCILKKATELLFCFKKTPWRISEVHITKYGSAHLYLDNYKVEILFTYQIRNIDQAKIIKKIERLKKVLKYFENYAQIKKIFIDLDCIQKGAVLTLGNING